MPTKKKPTTKAGKNRKTHKVMSEYKHGSLKSSSGKKVKSRKQAIAIAMSESGQSYKDKGRGRRGSEASHHASH